MLQEYPELLLLQSSSLAQLAALKSSEASKFRNNAVTFMSDCMCVHEHVQESEREPVHILDQTLDILHHSFPPCWPSSSGSSQAYH